MKAWKDITKEQRLDAIREAHGSLSVISAQNIAVHIGQRYSGVTRNAVVSFHSRYKDALLPLRLGLPGGVGSKGQHSLKAPNILKAAERQREPKVNPISFKPKAVMPDVPKPEPIGRELWELEPNDCRWPVEGFGAKTKFCCAPTAPALHAPNYCAYHAQLGTSAGTRSEQRAVELRGLKLR